MRKAIAFAALAAVLQATPASAEIIRPIRFPVDGPASFTDDFNDARSGGRVHEGNDILAAKMTPIVAPIDGRVRWLTETEQSYGWMLVIEDSEGWEYHHLHINNDTPGTDDGNGGRENAFAPGIYRGARVTKGQHIAWVGDSGNAESTAPHLHFEIHDGNGIAVNPYWSLINAEQPGRYDPVASRDGSPTINADKSLRAEPGTVTYCMSGSLIRSVSNPAVYYCGADGKRYVFPNDKVYRTWYADFSGVQIITDAELANISLGGNVTYRPGVKMVKITTDPKVYAVAQGGVLRHVSTSALAAELYGSGWAKMVEDVPDAYFINYKIGSPVTAAN